VSGEETSEFALATVTELDVTAQLQEQDDAANEMEIQGGKVDTKRLG
jgi:hypothetical protein